MTPIRLVIAAVGVALAAFVEPGDPIPGTSVGLEHDPEGIVASGTTDERGRVELVAMAGPSGILLPAGQALRVPVVARVEVGRTVQTSAPLLPGGQRPGRFMRPDGHRLVVAVPPGGGRVRVTLTEAGADGPGRGHRNHGSHP
jgi:hypothetical protein